MDNTLRDMHQWTICDNSPLSAFKWHLSDTVSSTRVVGDIP